MPNSEIFETVFRLVMCHLAGDYVLQSDFLAKTKGENWGMLLTRRCITLCCWSIFYKEEPSALPFFYFRMAKK